MPYLKSILMQIITALEQKEYAKLKELFEDVHPYDRAQVLMRVNPAQRKELVEFFSDGEMADIIQELEYHQQRIVLDEVGIERASQILMEMSYDDAADFLGELTDEKKQELFGFLDAKDAAEIQGLLGYPENSAGGLMTTELVTVPKDYTVEQTLARLRQVAAEVETIYYLYVVDRANHLIGAISLRELIIASPKEQITNIMSERVISVPVDMDQEEVARVMETYDFLALPVVDKNQKLIGIITIDDVLDVVQEEASEDMVKFGGISGKDSGVQDLQVGAWEAAKRRLPWLVLLLGIGIISGNIIAQFEETLEAVVILAVFIPMIADMAGNTGTQSLAVVVRGLAMGQFSGRDAIQLVKREAGVGLIIGTANGILISLMAALWQKNMWLGFVIGVSLWVTLFFATLAGTIIPLVMVRLKVDPAVASGPFITTVNDILGLTVYFTIATRFITYLT
ncbi:MAG: magnesium transporter [Bacillota bacterium]